MAALRSTWKGMLKIGVISVPVRTYSTSESDAKVRFNQLHRACGCRLKQQMVCPKCENTPVTSPDIIKGYEVGKDVYVHLEQTEIDAVQVASSHTLAIERFVPENQLDPLYIERSDYLAPDGKDNTDAFAIIREAMRGQIGIAKWAVRGRESLIALHAAGPGIVLHVLKTTKDVRTMDQIEDLALSQNADMAQVGLVKQVVGMMHEDTLNLNDFTDTYAESLAAMIKAKQNGEPLPVAAVPTATKATSLADQIRQTLELASAKKKPQAKATVTAKKIKKGKAA